MTPEAILSIAKLSDAGIIVVVVWIFISHMAKESRAFREHMAAQNALLMEFYKSMHSDHITQATESTRAVSQLVAVTEKNISATARNTFALEIIAKAIQVKLDKHQPIQEHA